MLKVHYELPIPQHVVCAANKAINYHDTRFKTIENETMMKWLTMPQHIKMKPKISDMFEIATNAGNVLTPPQNLKNHQHNLFKE